MKTTIEIPRTLLEEVFTIAILAQQRGDFLSGEAGREFPSHKLMEFITASGGLKHAGVIHVTDPPPACLQAVVPWEKDSMAVSKSVDSDPHAGNGSAPAPVGD